MKPPVCRAGEADARPGPEITGNVITMITTQPSSQPPSTPPHFIGVSQGDAWCRHDQILQGKMWRHVRVHYCIMLYYAMT